MDVARRREDSSDDSDFSDLDEPETPGDLLGYGGGLGSGAGSDVGSRGGSVVVRHTTTRGLSVESGKGVDHLDSKAGIPFVSIHKPRKGFTNIRADCWMNEPIRVSITDWYREDHPHMTRKAFNPNLYTINVTHGDYKWTIKRRYKHFDKLHKSLRLFRARYSLPVPTKQHRERRQSIKEDRKERKIKKKQQKKISRFPKKPEWMVRETSLEQRREHLEKYLQSVLESKWYRNHTELLKFLEVSELSFVNRLGQKWKEGDVNKCSGGRRISIGCCGCLKKYHVAGRWSKRWLVVKDTFVAYTRPSDGLVCDVLLMDSDFRVESGMSATGAPHGILITNLHRCLLAKAWTSRKADEWEENIRLAIDSTGKEFTSPIRYNSFAPVRDKSYARWFVDGSSYFEAVADALEKAKEEIFITDWWLSPEIYLKRNVTDRERWRLDEILGRKAKAGVKVFILLYKELEIALTINSHYSKHALMNKCPENIKVIRHPDHVAGGNRVLLWAHHEKIVVIDQKTAFLGGLDLCYGRWDDDKHRMTDLGSVTYDTIPDPNTKPPAPEATPVPYDIPNTSVHVNGIAHKHKERHRRTKCQSNNPHSPIMELDEDPMSEMSTGATGDSDHHHQQQHQQHEDSQVANGDAAQRKEPPSRSDSVQSATGVHISVDDMENMNRHSMRSEDEFGSNDRLADHDSLEELNSGYKNVVAEVMIHSPEKQTPAVSVSPLSKSSHPEAHAEQKETTENAKDSNSVKDSRKMLREISRRTEESEMNGEMQDSGSPSKQGAGGTHQDTSESSSNDRTGDHNNGIADSQTGKYISSSINDRSDPGSVECSNTCNKPEKKDNVPHGNIGKKSLVRTKRLSDDTVDGAGDKEYDFDALEKQIIIDNNKLNESCGSENMETSNLIKEKGTHGQQKQEQQKQDQQDSETISAKTNSETKAENKGANKTDTDMNRNQTKKLVSFKDHHGGTIQEETIIPAESAGGGLEASPKGKKDASAKRETWASKKLRKTLGLSPKAEKYEEEDQADGKDKSDSDENTSGGPGKFRNKWRMVLNVKKLEHAGKTSEDEETIPPESPYNKTPQGHASMSLTRLRQSMPFMNRRDSDEDLYYNLYPWKKRFWRRDEGSGVMVKSIMRMGNEDDAAQELEGLAGQSKLWIGKDYVNFIHKDPVDVQNPFEDFIDRSITPRMPWHDIGGVVYGKAARDVARHFIRRWNFCKTEKFKRNKNFPLLLPKSYQKCDVSQGIKDITYEVKTQILRSACGWSAGINTTESSIHQAYIDAIKKAKHYIYIENQFFITQVGDHALVKNEIGEALVSRIQRAHRNKEQFRVYVVMPLLPAFEGEIGESGGYPIQAVLHWNYKSISKGPNSVIANLQKTVDDPKKYILFCGLRTHTDLKNKLVTELIYVHSKLMIVDDDTVIIGSANINDRSMLGSRDSELAYLTEDIQKFPVKMGGVDHMAGRYASSLRRTLFREHLGIEETNFDVDLTDPVSDEFYKNVWLHQASVNTTVYYKVFHCIPDDHIKTFSQLKEVVAETNLAESDKAAAHKELQKVKGYLVLLPLYFLEFEESLIAMGAKKESLLPAKMWF